jgi:hypothetical protein
LTIVFRSYIAIVCIAVSAVSFLLEDLLVDIMIVDKVVGCSKYNEPSILIIEQGSCLLA